mgnify:CR=1 FL=1
MEAVNVLSLFNGLGCVWLALEEANVKVGKRYSSEIEKFPNQANDALYPDTEQLGDVRNVDVSKLEPISFLAGGSPCQSFSFAGKRKGMATKCEIEILSLEHYLELKEQNFEFEGQSYLFWEYIRILTDIRKYNPDVKFLLENVIMGSKWQKVITDAVGVAPIAINASLVSAQNRNRLFWFGQSRERLFYNDYLCYVCRKKEDEQKRKSGLLGKTQGEGEKSLLGKTQERQIYLYCLSNGISKNREKRNDQDLFCNLSRNKSKEFRQEQMQDKKGSLSKRIFKEEQTKTIGLSEGVQENREIKRGSKKSGAESFEKNSETDANAFASSTWNKEEAFKRRTDYDSKYGKEVCCVQCGEKLDYRPHHSVITWGNERTKQFTSPMSEMQFNEARQNNGRVFDTYKIGVKGLNSLFGETIEDIPQPKDQGILLKDILETDVDEKYFLSNKMLDYLNRNNEDCIEKKTGFRFSPEDDFNKKSKTIVQKEGSQMQNNFIVHNTMPRSSKTGKGGTGSLSRTDGKTYCLDTGNTNAIEVVGAIKFGRTEEAKLIRKENMAKGKDTTPFQAKEITGVDYEKMGTLTTSSSKDNLIIVAQRGRGENNEQQLEPRQDGKTNCLTSVHKDNLVMGCDFRTDEGLRLRSNGKSGTLAARARNDESCGQLAMINKTIRRLTPRECMRLQTVPEDKIDILLSCGISDTQLYKMAGNGWCIKVISHILKYL